MVRNALIFVILTASLGAAAQDDSRTVIGPRNVDLADGANFLKAGNAKEGIRLTRSGLAKAIGQREIVIAYSNLCAGLVLSKDYDGAFQYCDQALILDADNWHAYSNRALAHFYKKDYAAAENDVQTGLELNPHSSTLKKIGRMIDDILNPVEPGVIIEFENQPEEDSDAR